MNISACPYLPTPPPLKEAKIHFRTEGKQNSVNCSVCLISRRFCSSFVRSDVIIRWLVPFLLRNKAEMYHQRSWTGS